MRKFMHVPTIGQLNQFKEDVTRLSRQVKYLAGQNKNFPKLKTLNGFSSLFFNKDFNRAKVDSSGLVSAPLNFIESVEPSDCTKVYGTQYDESVYEKAIKNVKENMEEQSYKSVGMPLNTFYELINKYNVYPEYPFEEDGDLPKNITLFKRGDCEELTPGDTIDVEIGKNRPKKFTVMSIGELGTTGETTLSIQIGHWVATEGGGFCVG